MKIIHDIPPKQKRGEWVGVDIEIFNADKNVLHLPITGEFASLQIALENEEVYIITDTKDIQEALNAIENCMWCLMNGQFDIAHLRRWARVPDRDLFWDIMYIDKILWGGFFENFSFSLSDMVRRYFSVYLDKKIRDKFSDANELSDEMIQYGAEDALWNVKIAKKQSKSLSKEQFEKIWQDIDLPATWAFLSSKPMRVDKEKWKNIAIKHKEKQEEIDKKLPFNPRSPKQVKEHLRKTGFDDLPSTGAKVLKSYSEKHPDTEAFELATLTLQSRKYGKLASTYGLKWIEKYIFKEEDYWVVKPNYFTIGAETGRTASSDPNIQNIPSDRLFRGCFIPRPGNKLVVADYSAQEPRTAAYLSQDKEFISVINSGEDIYLQAGSHMYDSEEENKANRRGTKDVVLGSIYGLTPYGLSKQWGITVGSAEDFLIKFFKRYPRLKRYLDNLSDRTVYVETAVGRKVWLNKYSYQCPNNARNSPHQGTAADMMKRAIAVMYNDWKWGEWALVECVHDEVAFDVPEEIAEEIARWVKFKMIHVAEEMCPGVSFEVDVGICDSWAGAKE